MGFCVVNMMCFCQRKRRSKSKNLGKIPGPSPKRKPANNVILNLKTKTLQASFHKILFAQKYILLHVQCKFANLMFDNMDEIKQQKIDNLDIASGTAHHSKTTVCH